MRDRDPKPTSLKVNRVRSAGKIAPLLSWRLLRELPWLLRICLLLIGICVVLLILAMIIAPLCLLLGL